MAVSRSEGIATEAACDRSRAPFCGRTPSQLLSKLLSTMLLRLRWGADEVQFSLVVSSWERKGPGGPRGLQNRCGAARVVLGGFDSHALPP